MFTNGSFYVSEKCFH